MDIIIAGGGKIGQTLARQLVAEGHNLTVIDLDSRVLERSVEAYDAIGVMGNCASKEVLEKAGIAEAELVIATTDADEVNLLCCMTAHGLNNKVHTIARVRNPEYAEQIMTMPQVFPLSMMVNPEKQAAAEIERLLKYPGFLRRDAFAKGRAEIVELRIGADSKLKDVALADMSGVVKCRVLVCAVVRAGESVAPSGSFVLREGDRIFVTAPTAALAVLLKNLGIITRRVRSVLLCGASRTAYYLAELLQKDGIAVRLLDKDQSRCVEMATMLPGIDVICGDCSSQSTLDSQGIADCDALVSLTGVDETNMIVSLYAGQRGVPQVITKLSRGVSSSIADSLNLGSVVSPRQLCSDEIVRYVRAMENQTGAAVSVHAIADGQAEAVEFLVDATAKNCGIYLKNLKLKNNVLIASITRGVKTEVPGGDSYFDVGDTVVVVTSGRNKVDQFNDIFA